MIEYPFEVKDGVVVNVTDLNSGNFFCVTQEDLRGTCSLLDPCGVP